MMSEVVTGRNGGLAGLEAARDVLKQLVALDSVLVALGAPFALSVADSDDPTILAGIAAVFFLSSLVCGMTGLYRIVEETHSAAGSIETGRVRFWLTFGMGWFALATLALVIFIEISIS